MDISFLFSGQGSQYKGMGKNLITNYQSSRNVFEEASDVLHINVLEQCMNGSNEWLTDTENTQTILLTYEVAAFQAVMEYYDLEPRFLAGHSIGEISAITCAGGMEFPKALELVRERGRLMKKYGSQKGEMVALLGVSTEYLDFVCKKVSSKENEIVSISNYNSSKQTVIAGSTNGIQRVCEEVKKMHIPAIKLKVNTPFHCGLMKEAAEDFEAFIGDTQMEELRYPVVSNITGLPYTNQTNLAKYLADHIMNPVQWRKSVSYMYDHGAELFLQLGPKDSLQKMAREDFPNVQAFTIDKEDGLKGFEMLLKKERYDAMKSCLGFVVSEKNEVYQKEDYETKVIKPYASLKTTINDFIEQDKLPNKDDMKKVFLDTCEILKQKKKDKECAETCREVMLLYRRLEIEE